MTSHASTLLLQQTPVGSSLLSTGEDVWDWLSEDWISAAANGGTASPPPPKQWSSIAVAIMATLMGLFIAVGVLGNLAVVLAIASRRRGLRNKSLAFVLNLAVTDLCTSSLSMPLALVTLVHGRWIFGDWLCQLNAFTTELFFITSVHTLMYMSIYRFIGISRPLQRSRIKFWHVLLMLFSAWAYAATISGVTWQVLNHFLYKPHTTQCGPGFPSDYLGWIDLGVVTTTCFALPVIITVTMYGMIYVRIWQHLRRLQASSNLAEQQAYAQQRHMAVTLLIIVVVFIICWTPVMFYIVFISLAGEERRRAPALLNPVIYWLCYMNSAINPIIYSTRMPLLRHIVRRLCTSPGSRQQSLAVTEIPILRLEQR